MPKVYVHIIGKKKYDTASVLRQENAPNLSFKINYLLIRISFADIVKLSPANYKLVCGFVDILKEQNDGK